ncbi:NAD(P)-dependent oxidoreductase [Ignatzschineria sp. RMDPL8A]|uniref:NAD(P)-dependent oxidoreductase n=1 Tax=Ignatzschineria sp. RMDPL8A TaxID=2999236 RepID=UPI0024467C85|nr:NAD(P)-dependent oxidoreductase [Ignatzschineria sp. RMDPL8A]MDG9730459.1 NAD(P)-dependent oxidoreductase [Ignatzschineria sp. RMDPL8A]
MTDQAQTIAIIGASGKAGSLIMNEALARGHRVIAIVRNRANLTSEFLQHDHVTVLEKDLFYLTDDDLREADAVIDAFAVWSPSQLHLHRSSLTYLADLLSRKPQRLFVVGGAGSLYVDEAKQTRLMDTPDFPEAFKPLASHMAMALDELKKRRDVNWTYLSPATEFNADGARTGDYEIGGETLMINRAGKSEISYADYAIAMIDEVENGRHRNQHFSVYSK